MSAERTFVGKNFPDPAAFEKAVGSYEYITDSFPDNALHGAILFSDRAHARVVSIDASAAEKIPGVRVLTYQEAPTERYNSGEWFPGQDDHPDELILTGHVRHVGDRVALVVARDAQTALRARELVKVTYEDLPAIVDPVAAEDAAHLMHDDGMKSFPGRIAYGDVESAFAKAAHVAAHTISTPKIHHAAMETHALYAAPLPGGGVEVRTPCQIAYGVQYTVARALSLPFAKVRVVKMRTGGAFGGKQEVVFEPLCAWAACVMKKPVFISTTREETMLATRTRAAAVCRVSTALDEDGMILGRKFDVIVDAGAYLTGSKKVMMAMGKKVPRLYRIPALDYSGRTVRTTTTPAGACRGYGSPQSHAITEIHTDLLCKKFALDPVEFRMKNLAEPFDDDPSGASNLGNIQIRKCLEVGAEKFEWKKLAAPSGDGRFKRGAGFAVCTHGNGYYKTIYHDVASMSFRIFEDGSAVLRAGLHDLGHSLTTALAQIAGEVTGINPDRITVLEADTLAAHYDIGCQASRGIHVQGECARLCAQEAAALLCREAEKLWNVSARLEKGMLRVGAEVIEIGEAVRQIEMKNRVSIDVLVEHRPETNPASCGVHFADVTVDTLTGFVRINKYLAVHDVGTAINPEAVTGQIYGGVQMGIGMGLCEELAFDAKGKPSARNFDKYHMVNAPDMPEVEVILLDSEEDGGPFGAKSIGEIATVPPAPAIANAVNRALGTELTTLPLTPARILEALDALEQKSL
ncbi:molybdopterin-dependent oxidoreductase [Synergistaceae bacterium OttesenSCG-928-D05]|nr:molybdopterin-dependent oxidoreductase [Synergistaceae bacterium OttesenSCG-928-D05]